MAATGAAFILIGGVLAAVIVLTFPELPSTYCTDVGYRGDPPGGFEYYGVLRDIDGLLAGRRREPV